MKKLTIIMTLFIGLYSANVSASPIYAGLSFQKNSFDFEKGGDNLNQIGYDDISSNVSGFIGYEFDKAKFEPYQLSIEFSYFQDENSLHSNDGMNSDLDFNIISLNTIHHHYIDSRVSLIGIVGVNYVDFKFNEHSTESSHNVTDKDNGYGANIGVGFSYKLPEIYNAAFFRKMTLRTKIVHSVFKDVKPNVDSINQIDGMTAISIDFRFNF